MSGLEETLKDVKSVIRGLLISSTTKMTIGNLDSDFKKQEGCCIPYRQLGYASLDTFLYAITDTVYLREPCRGCPTKKLVVEPVQSKKTNHIEKMVMHQNTRTVKDMKRAPAQPDSKNKKWNNSPRFLPMNMRLALYSVCKKFIEEGLSLISLRENMNQYMHIINGWSKEDPSLWLKAYGFDSMEELIDTFIKLNLINVTVRNGTEWVIPVFKKEIKNLVETEIVKDDKPMKSSSNTSGAELSASNHYTDDARPSVMPAEDESHSEELSYENCWPISAMMCNYVRNNLLTVLRKHPEGLWCSHLPYEYKKTVGSELDVKNLGFVSMIEMVTEMKSTFVYMRPDKNSDWLLFDASSDLPCENFPDEEKKFSSIPRYIIENITDLLKGSPSGIKRHAFMVAYKMKYNEDLPMIDYGFESVTKLIAHLSELGIVQWKHVDGYLVVFGPKEYWKGKNSLTELYPKRVMRIHEKIPVQPLPDEFGCRRKIDILVTDVVNPSLFWYQRWRSDAQGQLRSLMADLKQFYNAYADDYKMPDGTIQIGQYCAALYPPGTTPSYWHRARITALPSLTEAVVIYVDYGTKSRVLRSELRFLHQQFSQLPIQAHKAGLFNIRPCNYGKWKTSGGSKPVWSSRTTDVFIGLVCNQPVVAVVAKKRELDMSVGVALIDTNTEKDKHINDILVNLEYAEMGERNEEDSENEDDDCNSVLGILRARARYYNNAKRDEGNPYLESEESRSQSIEHGNLPVCNPKSLLEFIRSQSSERVHK